MKQLITVFARNSYVCATFMLLVFGSARASGDYAIGMGDHIAWRSQDNQEVAYQVYEDSSTKFVRTGIDWRAIETSDNVYNALRVDGVDAFFAGCAARGIRVLAIIAYAPAWANGGHNESGWPPLDNDDYTDFCEWFVRRYAHHTDAAGNRTLEAIEVWNEPDLCDIFFKGYSRYAPSAATKYGQMVVSAGTRMRSVCAEIGASDILIAAPGISEINGAIWGGWVDAFYTVPNVTDAYDVFTWHSYWEGCGTTGWLPPELPPCWDPAHQNQAILGKLVGTTMWSKMVANGDDQKPNWCTEIGGAAQSATPDHLNRYLSFAEQESLFEDAISVLNAGYVNNLERLYFFEFFDRPHDIGSQQKYGVIALNSSTPIVYSGDIALVDATLTPKPAYYIYCNADKGGGDTPAGAFHDDFNDGNDDGWTAMPNTWTSVSGAYINGHNSSSAISYAGEASWVNYAAEADFMFSNPWSYGGVMARYDGSDGYYLRIRVNTYLESYSMALLVQGTVVSSTSINGTYDFSEYRRLGISVQDEGAGVRIRGYIDGTEHLDYLDTSAAYSSGKFAVRAEPWCLAIAVDNVAVYADLPTFADDFSDGNDDGWTATANTWSAVTGAYVNGHNAGTAISYAGDASWRDYAASADLVFSYAWKQAGIMARYNGTGGYYLKIGVNAAGESYTMQLLIAESVVMAVNINGIYDFFDFHNVKISVVDEAGGVRVKGFIDGTEHLNYLDTSATYSSGYFALRAEPWSVQTVAGNVAIYVTE
ncbi:MAG: hypothetical protein PF904_01395 [Kiritimatiellae bacterium]|jgi:hypothetical protein|nr:hypothetical protein [Kiritimatiellia bacterium]